MGLQRTGVLDLPHDVNYFASIMGLVSQPSQGPIHDATEHAVRSIRAKRLSVTQRMTKSLRALSSEISG